MTPRDNTFLSDFRRCPRYAMYRHRDGLVLPHKGVSVMDVGTIGHAAIAAGFDMGPGDEPLIVAKHLYDQLDDSEAFDTQEFTFGYIESVLDGYYKQYPLEQEPFEVLEVEQYLEAEIDGLPYCGIMDALVRFSDGGIYSMDHKFTRGYLSQAWFDSWRMSAQQIGYGALIRAAGGRWDGYYINAIHLNTRSYKVEPKHFQRYGPVRVPAWMLDEWIRNFKHTMDVLDTIPHESDWPQTTMNCFKWNKPCPYWRLCTVPPELRPGIIENDYDVEVWNPKERASGNA